MKVNKESLKKALEIVKPGLASSETIAQTTSFAFMKGCVITFNNEISISHPVPEIDFEGAVYAEELYKLLLKIKHEEVDLSIVDNQVVLKAGRTTAKFTLQTEIVLPIDEVANMGNFLKLPDKFCTAAEFVAPSCATAGSTAVLNCIHVKGDGVEASDNYRICKYGLYENMPIDEFLIPCNNALDVVKLNPIEIAKGEGWVHFKNEAGTVISSRIVEDNYPDTSHLFNVSGTEITLPKSLDDVLARAEVFKGADKLGGSVLITINENQLVVKTQSDFSQFTEDLNMKHDGKPIIFKVTTGFMRSILAETLTCIVGGNFLKFYGINWTYIVALRSME